MHPHCPHDNDKRGSSGTLDLGRGFAWRAESGRITQGCLGGELRLVSGQFLDASCLRPPSGHLPEFWVSELPDNDEKVAQATRTQNERNRGLARDSKSRGVVEAWGHPLPGGGFGGTPLGTLGLVGWSVENSWSQSDTDSLRCVCKGLGGGASP